MILRNLIIWPSYPMLSAFIWIVVTVLLLYLARRPAHHAILSLSRVVSNGFRLASRSVLLAEKRVAHRNREVLLAAGKEAVERDIEREFYRVNAVVQRDLQSYPTLHRSMSDLVSRIDQDYRENTETPPSPPGWIKAVEAVSKIPSTRDTMVTNILQDIHKTLKKNHHDAMEEYKNVSRKRHAVLTKMIPYWRKLTHTVDEVGKTITGLIERGNVIDHRMAEYEQIRARTDRAERTLSSSSMTQFFISAFVLLIATGGAIINFNLIALPMSEMVGGGSYLGPFKTSDVAALVIIFIECAMGIYLLESLRITRLFPVIGALDDKLRKRMIWIAFTILLVLACVEASLAFMRDMIAADLQALRQSLASNIDVAQPANRWIPTVGQMVMGFVLPFALTFVAIPLESFVYSSRTVMGVVFIAFIRSVAFLLRLFGNMARYLGSGLVNLYDLLIFPALWAESHLKNRKQTTKFKPKEGIPI